jgi:hypothetical protein
MLASDDSFGIWLAASTRELLLMLGSLHLHPRPLRSNNLEIDRSATSGL